MLRGFFFAGHIFMSLKTWLRNPSRIKKKFCVDHFSISGIFTQLAFRENILQHLANRTSLEM